MSKPVAGSAPLRWGTAPLIPADLTEPDGTHMDEGWQAAEEPPHSYFNYWMNLVYLWVSYLDNITAEALTWTALETFSAGIHVTNTVTSDYVVTTQNVVVGNNLSVAQSATITHDLEVDGDTELVTLGASGASTLHALTCTTLHATGAATLSSTLGVTGASTLTGLLTASGGITAAGTTAVQTFTAALNATITGVVTALGGLSVGNGALISGGLTVTGGTLSDVLSATVSVTAPKVVATGTASSIPLPVATNATLAGSWVQGTGTDTLSFYKDAFGIVHLQGGVKSGSGTITTLPAGFLPAAGHTISFPQTNSAGTAIIISITTAGVVTSNNNTGDQFFDGITFRAA